MSSTFAKIFHQAEKTFALLNKDSLRANLTILTKLIDILEFKHLNIDPHIASKRAFQRRDKAPCTFVNVCELESFTMSVFIINAGYTMPLHDHPKMSGLLKVISGKLRIQSYTRIPSADPSDLLVSPEEPKILDSQSASSYLDDKQSNFHEITALDEPAAFFDVLSPPYSDMDDNGPGSRHCHFYRKLAINSNILKLERIECPSHYYCDSVLFERPQFMEANS